MAIEVPPLPVIQPFIQPAVDAVSGAVSEQLPSAAEYSDLVATALVLAAAATVANTIFKVLLQFLLTPLLKATERSDSVSPNKYELGKSIGRGNYGSVYEGYSGSSEEPTVVVKVASGSDGRAEGFALAELFMNRKLSLCGQGGAMAKFEGHYYEGGSLHLVFKREGSLTLDKALNGGFPWNVEYALLGKESQERSADEAAAVIRKIAGQLFRNLAGIHGWNVVHRDVKGANLILAESERRFKLLDFGAACDLFSRENYDPTLQVFDPKYGPPECTVLQAQRGEGGLDVGAGGKFDVFSAGLLVVQMCFPPYRSDSGLVQFKKTLAAVEYDLDKWREAAELRKENELGFQILDKYGGMALLKGCLKREPGQRISSASAASSGFCA